jgi:hypothetical protein
MSEAMEPIAIMHDYLFLPHHGLSPVARKSIVVSYREPLYNGQCIHPLLISDPEAATGVKADRAPVISKISNHDQRRS